MAARAALLGADDAAVEKFLAGEIAFVEIAEILERTVARAWAYFSKDRQKSGGLLERGIEIYRWARHAARESAREAVLPQ